MCFLFAVLASVILFVFFQYFNVFSPVCSRFENAYMTVFFNEKRAKALLPKPLGSRAWAGVELNGEDELNGQL